MGYLATRATAGTGPQKPLAIGSASIQFEYSPQTCSYFWPANNLTHTTPCGSAIQRDRVRRSDLWGRVISARPVEEHAIHPEDPRSGGLCGTHGGGNEEWRRPPLVHENDAEDLNRYNSTVSGRLRATRRQRPNVLALPASSKSGRALE
jgi:hypothetical protein